MSNTADGENVGQGVEEPEERDLLEETSEEGDAAEELSENEELVDQEPGSAAPGDSAA